MHSTPGNDALYRVRADGPLPRPLAVRVSLVLHHVAPEVAVPLIVDMAPQLNQDFLYQKVSCQIYEIV